MAHIEAADARGRGAVLPSARNGASGPLSLLHKWDTRALGENPADYHRK